MLALVVAAGVCAAHAPIEVAIDWAAPVAQTRANPTWHVSADYGMQRRDRDGEPNPTAAAVFASLKASKAVGARFMVATDGNGFHNLAASACPYPPDPATNTTHWDLRALEPYISDFCAASAGGDCSDTLLFHGPLPPWFFYDSPTNRTRCDRADSGLCTGALIDLSGRAAGEYFSRVLSWLTKGYLIDEFGRRVGGGTRLAIQHFEVFNEPNGYKHFHQPATRSPVEIYTRVYDGVTSVIQRDHPQMKFAAMCWASFDVLADFEYFLTRGNHAAGTPWPPAYLTFHIYSNPLNLYVVQQYLKQASDIVGAIRRLSPETRPFVDELGVFPCPDIDYSAVLDGGADRFRFWNPKAAWQAAMYAELAKLGVAAMGASSYFGYPTQTALRRKWHGPTPGPDCRPGGEHVPNYCGFPCLSALDWDGDAAGRGNPRYHVLKLLVEAFGGDAPKSIANVTLRGQPPPAPPPGPCAVLSTTRNSTFHGGRFCEYALPNASAAACGASCCATDGCQHFVLTEGGAAPPHEKLYNCNQIGPPCAAGGNCCWLKSRAAVPWPYPTPGSTRGTTSPADDRQLGLVAMAAAFGGADGRPARRALLLVNTNNASVRVRVPAAAVGRPHAWVDEQHGHGLTPAGSAPLGAAELAMAPFQVSALDVSA